MTYTIADIASLFQCSKTTMYSIVHEVLPERKLGRGHYSKDNLFELEDIFEIARHVEAHKHRKHKAMAFLKVVRDVEELLEPDVNFTLWRWQINEPPEKHLLQRIKHNDVKMAKIKDRPSIYGDLSFEEMKKQLVKEKGEEWWERSVKKEKFSIAAHNLAVKRRYEERH